jgi:hypothetical protein
VKELPAVDRNCLLIAIHGVCPRSNLKNTYLPWLSKMSNMKIKLTVILTLIVFASKGQTLTLNNQVLQIDSVKNLKNEEILYTKAFGDTRKIWIRLTDAGYKAYKAMKKYQTFRVNGVAKKVNKHYELTINSDKNKITLIQFTPPKIVSE